MSEQSLSIETVYAAQNGDAAARQEISSRFEGLIHSVARQAATTGGHTNESQIEDYVQDGWLALLTYLPRFEGEHVGQFVSYLESHIRNGVGNAQRNEHRQGVSERTMKRFTKALRLAEARGGDVYEAMSIATDRDLMKSDTLTRATANAARQAYMGTDSLDRPAATERNGSGNASHVVTLGDTLLSTIGIPEDLIESADITRALNKIEQANDAHTLPGQVHEILSQLGEQQQIILCALTGVGDVSEYGPEYDDQLAADYGLNRKNLTSNRHKSRAAFSRKYVATFGEWDQ